MLLCAVLAIAPDADFILEWVFHIRDSHRGFTHSIAFCVIAGLFVSSFIGDLNVRSKMAIVLAPVSHGLLDAFLTSRHGTGIELLWPLSDHGFKLGMFDYFLFRLDPRFDPWSEILIRVLEISLIELIIMGPLFTLLIVFKLRKQNAGLAA